MKLNLSFYTPNSTGSLVLPSAETVDKGKIVFDQVNDRIGANNFWFGSTYAKATSLNSYLPLAGGQMTGPIRYGSGGANSNAALILSNKPIIIDNYATTNNTIRYLAQFNGSDSILLGNYRMYTKFLSWNGDLKHIISSNNQDNGTLTEYSIFDANNSGFTATTNYGYTVKLGGTSQNLLGIGKLSPSLSMENNSTTLTLTVGGETCSTTIKAAAIAGSAASLTGTHYFSLNTQTQEIGEPGDDNYEVITNDVESELIYILPGNQSTNKLIVDTNYLKIIKVPAAGYAQVTNNPKSYNLKLTLSDALINRIAALEARDNVSFNVINN